MKGQPTNPGAQVLASVMLDKVCNITPRTLCLTPPTDRRRGGSYLAAPAIPLCRRALAAEVLGAHPQLRQISEAVFVGPRDKVFFSILDAQPVLACR